MRKSTIQIIVATDAGEVIYTVTDRQATCHHKLKGTTRGRTTNINQFSRALLSPASQRPQWTTANRQPKKKLNAAAVNTNLATYSGAVQCWLIEIFYYVVLMQFSNSMPIGEMTWLSKCLLFKGSVCLPAYLLTCFSLSLMAYVGMWVVG